MALKGAPQLRARLKAIRETFKPVGRKWAQDTVQLAQARVPVATGRTRRSIRVRNASQRKAVVVAAYGARFIEGGTQAHDIRPRRKKVLHFKPKGGTGYSMHTRHPAAHGRPFLGPAARESLRRNPMAAELIRQWNQAA